MGYNTDFSGEFTLDKPLTPEQVAYLTKFNNTRRMKREPYIAEQLPDPERIAVGLPIGEQGAYFVGGLGFCGQDDDDSVIEHNYPPTGQPGLWCQWVPTEDGKAIKWDEGEKFYDYVEWLYYLIEHFLKPWGYVLDGEVYWYGGDSDDRGIIVVTDNNISFRTALPIEYGEPVPFP